MVVLKQNKVLTFSDEPLKCNEFQYLEKINTYFQLNWKPK